MFKKILWMQKSCNVLKYSFDYFIYTFSWVFPLLINEVDQMFVVSRSYNMQRQVCFWKLVCFFPWLAGRFHNFELTQNREKTRNGLTPNRRAIQEQFHQIRSPSIACKRLEISWPINLISIVGGLQTGTACLEVTQCQCTPLIWCNESISYRLPWPQVAANSWIIRKNLWINLCFWGYYWFYICATPKQKVYLNHSILIGNYLN
jgi:hypothetical protein